MGTVKVRQRIPCAEYSMMFYRENTAHRPAPGPRSAGHLPTEPPHLGVCCGSDRHIFLLPVIDFHSAAYVLAGYFLTRLVHDLLVIRGLQSLKAMQKVPDSLGASCQAAVSLPPPSLPSPWTEYQMLAPTEQEGWKPACLYWCVSAGLPCLGEHLLESLRLLGGS